LGGNGEKKQKAGGVANLKTSPKRAALNAKGAESPQAAPRVHHIRVYTDGCAFGNPGPGGWAFILESGRHYKEASGGYRHTTNNRMELTAAIRALEAIKAQQAKVDVYTDSQYVAKAFTEGWLEKWRAKGFAKRPNADLWRRLDELVRRFDVTFHWVKGHAGHPQNERCDRLAKEAAKHPQAVDRGYQVKEGHG